MIYCEKDKIELFIVKPTDTIIEVMKRMSKVSSGLLAVCDGRKFIGVISDGDIRRSLLRGLTLNSAIDTATNVNPKIIKTGMIDSALLNKTLANLQVVPQIDNHNNLIGLYINKPNDNYNDVNVIIMAGGLGTRLKPITKAIPKALVPVLGRPLIEHVINGFMSYGFTNFTIVLNHMKEKIKTHLGDGSSIFCKIDYVEEENFLGTAGGISLVEKKSKYIFVSNCDIITTINYRNLLDKLIKEKADFAISTKKYNHKIPYGVIDIKDNKIKIIEKPNIEKNILSGIYLFSSMCLKSLNFGSKIDMPQFLIKLSQKHKFIVVPTEEDWFDVGRVDTINEVQTLYGDLKND